MLADIDRLSLRQRQVLHLCAQGLNYPEIAEELCLSPDTVKNHAWAMLGALGLDSIRAATFQYGVWLGERGAGMRPVFDELPLADRIAIATAWLRREGAATA